MTAPQEVFHFKKSTRDSLLDLTSQDDVVECVRAEVHRASHQIDVEDNKVVDEPGDVPEEETSDLRVAAVVTAYMVVSITIVFFNRYLYTNLFPYVVVATWLQQVIGTSALFLLSLVHLVNPNLCPNFVASPSKIITAIPLTIAFCGMTSLGNLCLASVQVATYQVARCLTLPFTILFSLIILSVKQSRWVIASTAVVVAGFVVCALDADALSPLGAFQGAVSSVFQAAYLVAIKMAIRKLGNNENIVLFCNAFIACFMLIPVIFYFGEGEGLVKLWHLSPSSNEFYRVWGGFYFSSFLALTLTWVSFVTVKITSPVTFNVAGIVKATLQTILGLLTGDTLGLASGTGVVLRTVGSAWYSIIKHREKQRAAAVLPTKSPAGPSSYGTTSAT
eukprot:GHVN01035311.1.p1 GENE.GHVN01035311.1~~GHVN01035311.1.p1  ORF type:complete len:391 (-),score=30.38 GHVN01035311.1:70-1242(-)